MRLCIKQKNLEKEKQFFQIINKVDGSGTAVVTLSGASGGNHYNKKHCRILSNFVEKVNN